MNIFLCREVLAFWFADCSFQSGEAAVLRKSSVPYLCVHIKEVPLHAVSAYWVKTQVMTSKQTSEKQRLEPVK